MISRDGILLWSPVYDTNEETGGLTVFKGSHKDGFEHKLENKKLGKKSWTKDYTHIDKKILERYEKINLKVKSKSAVLMINSMVHCGYQMKKNNMRELLLQKDITFKKTFFKKEMHH